MSNEFIIKDSGEREQYESGMVRDTAGGKTDFTLGLDGPMFERYCLHLQRASKDPDHAGEKGKYPARNWLLGNGDREFRRARRSALRHLIQWLHGDVDEDHASAVIFNLNVAENIKAKNPDVTP